MRAKAGHLFPVMAWAVLASALLTVTMGGVVRVTGSGFGCPDWPLCQGRVIPPLSLGPWIEYLHRLSAASLGVITALAVATGVARYRWGEAHLYLVLLVPVLLAVQALLGGLTVLLELSSWVALAHTGLAAGFVGLLAVMAAAASSASWVGRGALESRNGRRLWRLVAMLALVAFIQVLSGSYVTRTGASLACLGFPLCGAGPGGMVEPQWVQMAHRALALLLAVLAVAVVRTAWAIRHKGLLTATGLLTGILIIQIGLGATNVVLRLPAWARGAHLALALFIFAGLMWMLGAFWQALHENRSVALPERPSGTGSQVRRATVAYFRLTKPRIVVLLLVSTAAGMFAASGGTIPWLKVVATLLGGALCAGGAKAMNSYLDRESDRVMHRTRHRPLPMEQVSPKGALAFSICISLLSVPFFLWVSHVAAILAVVAWFYYVGFYSVYLKRRTYYNVVIGGAAGAFPPLIGWTAVKGSVGLEAVFLFLIIFFWTPPHAWALMTLLKEDYRKVGIPMLPVVRGARDTTRQILVYSTVLVVLTLIPVGFRLFGPLYLGMALPLGSIFLALAVKLYLSQKESWAWRLYRYSTVYLALLLLGLVLDHMF